jgi:hypothetical protein
LLYHLNRAVCVHCGLGEDYVELHDGAASSRD